MDAKHQFKDLDNTKYREIDKEIKHEFKRVNYNANQGIVGRDSGIGNKNDKPIKNSQIVANRL